MSETNKVMSSIQFPNTDQPYQVNDARIPADPGAYKYMATDGEGNWVAEDRLAWEEENPGYILPPFEVPTGTKSGVNIDTGYKSIDFEDRQGETFVVVWDGTTYECPVLVLGGMFSNTYYIGNIAITDLDEIGAGIDTGEPFCIISRGSKNFWVFSFTTPAPHTVSIGQPTETTHKISPEYLPEGIGYKETTVLIPDGTKLTLEGELVCKATYTPAEFVPIVANKTYQFAYDGNTLECVVDEETGRLWFDGEIYIENTENAESYTVVCPHTGGPFDVTIGLQLQETHPIPAEYIPRIVFTYDGTNYACNVPFDDFEAAVMSGLPMSYVDMSDGLWVCTNIIVNKVGSGFEVFVYRSSGTEDIVLEYTSSGLNEVVDEA